MATQLNHKIGDTFVAHGLYKDETGVPVNLNLSGISVQSAVLDPKSKQVFPLTVTLADQTTEPGVFTLSCQTADWPLGKLLWDVEYTQGTYIFSTETVVIKTEQDVTP